MHKASVFVILKVMGKLINLILLGPQGSGKGTQAKLLEQKYDFVFIGMGDTLREIAKEDSELGQAINQMVNVEGRLVDDGLVGLVIESKFHDVQKDKSLIVDGFPRTVLQAEALDKLLLGKNTEIHKMIALEVSDEELTKRLLKRGLTSGREDDRNEEKIRTRISEYNNKTMPLIDYYKKQKKFFSVIGIGEVGEIFEKICQAIHIVI